MFVRSTRRHSTLLILSLIAVCVGIVECLAATTPSSNVSSSPGVIGGDQYIVAQASDLVNATDEDIPKNPVPAGGTHAAAVVDQISYKTPWEAYLAGFTILLGIGFMALYCFAHRGTPLDHTFSRNFIILAVIFSALFLIVAGYSERQTAPVFGLLGTIVGYLFGAVAGKAQAQIDAETAASEPSQGSHAVSTSSNVPTKKDVPPKKEK